MTSAFSWQNLLVFALLHSVFQGKICLLLQVFLDFLLLHFPFPYDEKNMFFWGCQFQKGLQVIIEPFNFSFFSITGWHIDLDYCDIEWFSLEMSRFHSVILEMAPKYCISDSFVDYEGYSIFSKGFLPLVVYIMVISHFCSLIPEMSITILPSPA